MSKVQVDTIVNKAGTGAPSFPLGANITGIITASLLSSPSYRGQNNQLSIGSSVVTIDTPVEEVKEKIVQIEPKRISYTNRNGGSLKINRI